MRAWLFDSPNAQRNSADIAEQLHKECVLRQSAGHHQLVDLNPGVPERLDDGTRPESCRLQQGPVLVLGGGGESLTQDHSRQVGIREHRPVAVVPVQGNETMGTDLLPRTFFGKQVIDTDAPVVSLVEIRARDAVVDKPGEDVAHRRLPSLESPRTIDDPTVDDAKHSGDFLELGPGNDVARRSTHDRSHLAVLHCLHGGRSDVGVNVAAGHRGADW